MTTIHLANISYEEELAAPGSLDLIKGICSHPLYLQLQFLPFLYGSEDDFVYTTCLPPQTYFENLKTLGIKHPKSALVPPHSAHIEAWGPTPSVKAWAKDHHLSFEMPPWEVIRVVNSKAFSFIHSAKLPGADLIANRTELKSWIEKTEGPKVLKSCFGVSGRGHFHVSSIDDPSLKAFVEREWSLGRPLIAEPWVERRHDFSTQWKIFNDGKIEYIGFTICENDARGHYRATVLGNPKKLLGCYAHFLEIHLEESRHLLNQMQRLGFYGNVGFDAMIYNEGLLQPIVEINARKTMGWVALAMQKKHFPNKPLRIFLADRKNAINALLPSNISTLEQREITFHKQLCVDFIDL